MIYLLDADTLITSDNTFYPFLRFPIFWQWLRYNGEAGLVKIPIEQYEEVVVGRGELVDWLKEEGVKNALLLDEEADPDRVSEITATGYARDLDEAEIGKIGRDPFLISYGYADVENRFVVTFESSAPNKQRSNRKIPDVCNQFNVQCGNIYDVIETLDFTTDWVPD